MTLRRKKVIANFKDWLWLPPSAFAGLLVVLVARGERHIAQAKPFETTSDPQIGRPVLPDTQRNHIADLAKGRPVLLAVTGTCSSCALNKLDSRLLVASKSLKIEVYRNGEDKWASTPPSAGFDKRLHLSDAHFEKLNALWYPRLYRLSSTGELVAIQTFGGDPNEFIREAQ